MDTDEHAPAQAVALNNVQLGELLDVTSSYASYLRSGRRLPGAATQQRIVERFGVSFEDLNRAIVAARSGDLQPIRALMASIAGELPPAPAERDWGARSVKCERCGARYRQPCRTRGGETLPFGEEHQIRKDRAATRVDR